MTDDVPYPNPAPPLDDLHTERNLPGAPAPQKVPYTPSYGASVKLTPEEAMRRDIRQTRQAAVFLAWLVGLLTLFAIIGGIIALVHLHDASAASNCLSTGGTNPNC